ncbi:hypothetical protein C0J52_27727 [Blattella germanica]|nr:hypothetical protein C0J52_27727 [Blattella germanica]
MELLEYNVLYLFLLIFKFYFRQRSLTIEEILTELELLDSTQVEDVERSDILSFLQIPNMTQIDPKCEFWLRGRSRCVKVNLPVSSCCTFNHPDLAQMIPCLSILAATQNPLGTCTFGFLIMVRITYYVK